MTSTELQNLAKTGALKREPATADETSGLLKSATVRLKDAQNPSLSFPSRFDLAYNAAHAVALLALRKAGYRSENRYLVFQCLQHTAGLPASKWRVLDHAHRQRNIAEYQGHLEEDEKLLAEVISIAQSLLKTAA